MTARDADRAEPAKPSRTPAVSVRADGILVEMILRTAEKRSVFVVSASGAISEVPCVEIAGREYVPYSADNSLLTHGVVLLPTVPAAFGSPASLLEEVRAFIHRYVDVSEAFEEVAAHYVLMTWLYDSFSELPYLRVRGEYGSGKSRFLLTIGSICYKPIFASGASTTSPLFRLMDEIGGTLVLDEADFFASDERAEIVKILNNGSTVGFPVLRSDVTPSKEFRPRAFNIFGPKVVATRHRFQDPALESRCLTEVFGTRRLRSDVPISLPAEFRGDALALRNKLLTYRFRRALDVRAAPSDTPSDLPPRRRQILSPLLAVAVDAAAKQRICDFVRGQAAESAGHDAAASHVLATARTLIAESVPLTLWAIAERFNGKWSGTYGITATPRWIGSILRRLGIQPFKSNGVYRIGASDMPLLQRLIEEHGGDVRDERDSQRTPERRQ